MSADAEFPELQPDTLGLLAGSGLTCGDITEVGEACDRWLLARGLAPPKFNGMRRLRDELVKGEGIERACR